jgi:hypothetical protein
MASLLSIRQAVQKARAERNLPHYAYQPWDRPQTEIIQQQLNDETSRHLHAGFQTLKEPGEGDDGDESKMTMKQRVEKKKKKKRKESLVSLLMDGEREVDRAAEEEVYDEKHKVPWKNPPLTNEGAVRNLDAIIPTLRSKKVAWDDTPAGKRSQTNFFNWIEEYSRIEHKKKRDLDMSPFI